MRTGQHLCIQGNYSSPVEYAYMFVDKHIYECSNRYITLFICSFPLSVFAVHRVDEDHSVSSLSLWLVDAKMACESNLCMKISVVVGG